MKECQFCSEPAQSKYAGRLSLTGSLYCTFHAGWYQGVLSVAKLEHEKNPGHRLAIEGLPFEESLIPHAPKLDTR